MREQVQVAVYGDKWGQEQVDVYGDLVVNLWHISQCRASEHVTVDLMKWIMNAKLVPVN